MTTSGIVETRTTATTAGGIATIAGTAAGVAGGTMAVGIGTARGTMIVSAGEIETLVQSSDFQGGEPFDPFPTATCGWIAERYPEATQAIAQQGHEIAGHGYPS